MDTCWNCGVHLHTEEEMTEAETYTCEECGGSFHIDEAPAGCFLDESGFHCGCS